MHAGSAPHPSGLRVLAISCPLSPDRTGAQAPPLISTETFGGTEGSQVPRMQAAQGTVHSGVTPAVQPSVCPASPNTCGGDPVTWPPSQTPVPTGPPHVGPVPTPRGRDCGPQWSYPWGFVPCSLSTNTCACVGHQTHPGYPGPRGSTAGRQLGPHQLCQEPDPGFQRGGGGTRRRAGVRRASSGATQVGGVEGSQLCPEGLQSSWSRCVDHGQPWGGGCWARPSQALPSAPGMGGASGVLQPRAVITLCFVSTGCGDLSLRAADHPEEGVGQT